MLLAPFFAVSFSLSIDARCQAHLCSYLASVFERERKKISMPFLTVEAARTLRLDQKPDGTHILFKVIALPSQYVLHYFDGREEVFRGTSTTRLGKAFGALAVDSGWLPPGVCRWGRRSEGDWMVRYYPPAHYSLQFGDPQYAGSFRLDVPLPGIVFAGFNTTYYVWAIKDSTCTPQTPLFAAPLPNVFYDGRICYGSNTPPAVSAEAWSTIDTAWQLFMTSPFIGDLASGKSRAHPADVRTALVHVAQSTSSQYPLEDLVPHTTHNTTVTMGQVITALIASKA